MFGEQHEQPDILKAQLCILEGMASQEQNNLVVVLEMFNFQQQSLLDAYQNHQISLNELQEKYTGTEGFAIINHYGCILEAARTFGVRVVAGFTPRTLGRTIINEGKETTLRKIHKMGGPSEDFYIDGTESHYRYFQGLISGNMVNIQDKYRKIFPSQVLKDSYFAHTVSKIVDMSDEVKVLGICGSGHIDYGYGAPERIANHIPTLLITSRMKDDPIETEAAHYIYQY